MTENIKIGDRVLVLPHHPLSDDQADVVGERTTSTGRKLTIMFRFEEYPWEIEEKWLVKIA